MSSNCLSEHLAHKAHRPAGGPNSRPGQWRKLECSDLSEPLFLSLSSENKMPLSHRIAVKSKGNTQGRASIKVSFLALEQWFSTSAVKVGPENEHVSQVPR